MSRWVLALALLAGGCTFDTRGSGGRAGPDPDADLTLPDADRTLPDADPDAPDASTDCLVWETSFDEDPTTLDVNADGVADWTMRDGAAFPIGEISGGLWAPQQNRELDTRPLHDFGGTTIVSVRMRATSQGDPGAVFWVNADYTATSFAAIHVSARLDSSSDQEIKFFTDQSLDIANATHPVDNVGNDLVDIGMMIDAASDEVSLIVNGNFEGTFSYTPISPLNGDRWATVTTLGTVTGEFDYVKVESCP